MTPDLATISTTQIADAPALAEAFLSGRNKRTIQAYRTDLADFTSFVGSSDLNAAAGLLLGQGHGRANALALRYKAALLERGLQPTTINRRLAALRSLVKLARTMGLVPWALEIENVKGLTRYRDTAGPGRSAVQVALDTLSRTPGPKAKRDAAVVHLLYDLGLRRAEVVGLDLDDLDLQAGTVAVLGKGYTQKQTLSLPEPTRAALALWLDARGSKAGALFVNYDRAGKGKRLTGSGIYYLIRRLGIKIGKRMKPHGLRHSAITEAIKAATACGFDLEEVRAYSRHKDIRTLVIYRDQDRNRQGELANHVAESAQRHG